MRPDGMRIYWHCRERAVERRARRSGCDHAGWRGFELASLRFRSQEDERLPSAAGEVGEEVREERGDGEVGGLQSTALELGPAGAVLFAQRDGGSTSDVTVDTSSSSTEAPSNSLVRGLAARAGADGEYDGDSGDGESSSSGTPQTCAQSLYVLGNPADVTTMVGGRDGGSW